MIRLNMIVEGQTEETFARDVLTPHLARREVYVSARCVETGRRRGRHWRGGLRDYARPRRDIQSWLKEDQNSDARFTTMFDVYALPCEFPGFDQASGLPDAYRRVELLEQRLANDIGDWRFLPYLQLHEFEALLFADPAKFAVFYPGRDAHVAALTEVAAAFATPELIDDGDTTAPSKRILEEFSDYEKIAAGVEIAQAVGLEAMRTQCPHFAAWLSALEALAQLAPPVAVRRP